MPTCPFCTFGFIVTGKTEKDHLPALFSSLTKRAGCSFQILRRTGQRSPLGPVKQLRIVRSGGIIPNKDEEEIGLPARRFLRGQPCRFLILIDDLEHDRREQALAIFQRYRTALDTLLQEEERSHASVHFLVNMLEAYYFAHSRAVNQALGTTLLKSDHDGDVEQIRHPKNDLKKLFGGFDERRHGGLILRELDLEHVLRDPAHCKALRALIAWCVRKMVDHCPIYDAQLAKAFQLSTGEVCSITGSQA
jgi:hypothetical protein